MRSPIPLTAALALGTATAFSSGLAQGTTTPAGTVISTVEVSGLEPQISQQFKQQLAEKWGIEPGKKVDQAQLDAARAALAQAYRDEGFPFEPQITTQVVPGTATVRFSVDETAPLTRIEVAGVSSIPAARVSAMFRPLYDAKRFTRQAFGQAMAQLNQAYEEAEVLGCGLAERGVTLEGGVLRIRVIERTLSQVDTAGLSSLKNWPKPALRPGQVLRLSELNAAVQAIANATRAAVGYELRQDPQHPDQVVVAFGVGEGQGGVIKAITFAGNTAVPTSTLQAALELKVGDAYAPQVVADQLRRLHQVYAEAGYSFSDREVLSFKDGQLTFTLHEAQLAGFKLKWSGAHRTADRVILRELPPSGGPVSQQTLGRTWQRLNALGFVQLSNVTVESDPKLPERLTYVLHLRESERTFGGSPALAYDNVNGLSGEASVNFSNMFGQGHNLGLRLSGTKNDAKQFVSGGINYTIPWLDLDFADFKQQRTSLSLGLSSDVTGNSTLLDKNKQDTGRDFTVRQSGARVGLGRALTPQLTAGVNLGYSYRQYWLEPLKGDEKSTLSDADAQALLPKNGYTVSAGTTLEYDSTDNPNFPGRGLRADGRLEYSIGRAGSTPLSWTEAEVGVRGYYGFGDQIGGPLGSKTFTNVLAARANFGTTLGNYPEGQGYALGGSSMIPSRELRGLEDGQAVGTQYFSTGVEYRRDLGLRSSLTQGVYGIVFADYGGVWSPGKAYKSSYGVGVGLQLNLALGSMGLPPLRFDYGYSPQNSKSTAAEPTKGRFHFRLGTVW